MRIFQFFAMCLCAIGLVPPSSSEAATRQYDISFQFQMANQTLGREYVSGNFAFEFDTADVFPTSGTAPIAVLDFNLFVGSVPDTTQHSRLAFSENNVTAGGRALGSAQIGTIEVSPDLSKDENGNTLAVPTPADGNDFQLQIFGNPDLGQGNIVNDVRCAGIFGCTGADFAQDNAFQISFATAVSGTLGIATYVPPGDPAPAVPLPASALLLLAGLGGFAAIRRRKI